MPESAKLTNPEPEPVKSTEQNLALIKAELANGKTIIQIARANGVPPSVFPDAWGKEPWALNVLVSLLPHVKPSRARSP